MKTTSTLSAAALAVALAGGCGTQDGNDPIGPEDMDPGSPGEVNDIAAETAVEVSGVVTDIGRFVADAVVFEPGFAAPGPESYTFAPASCSGSVELGPGTFSLEKDCTLPSGRHVQGMLVIEPGACGFKGFRVEYDLLVESEPGAGDEVDVEGSVKLSIDPGALYLAVEHRGQVQGPDHTVEKEAAGCFVLDKNEKIAALDGAISLALDGETKFDAQVADLQHAFCESLPYTGQMAVEHPPRSFGLGFERLDADTVLVTVDEDGDTYEAELPVLKAPGPLCYQGVPSPTAFDYESCGGCGHPNPPDDLR